MVPGCSRHRANTDLIPDHTRGIGPYTTGVIRYQVSVSPVPNAAQHPLHAQRPYVPVALQVVPETIGSQSSSYNDFICALPDNQCRYAGAVPSLGQFGLQLGPS